MTEEESWHWDTICIGLMTLETLVVVGMFGLLGFGGATNESIGAKFQWTISFSAIGASLIYLFCIGSGTEAIFDTPLIRTNKLAKCRALANGFVATVGFVVVVACITVVSQLDLASANAKSKGSLPILGTAQVGETLVAYTWLVADDDGIESATFSYQWLADGAAINGATRSKYTLASSEEGKAITVTVSFTDDNGNDESLTSEATDAVVAKPNTPASGAPAIAATVQVGKTLTADTSRVADDDGLRNVEFSYQWLADGADISGAVSSTYTPAESEEGKAITVMVSFTDDAGNEESLTSAAMATVAGAGPMKPQRNGELPRTQN